jgi:hypothetical protein
MLEERRSKLRVTIIQILYDTATDAGLENDSRNCSCAWSGRHFLAHTELLNEYNLQPRNIPDMTVAQVIEKMERMRDPVVPQPREPCKYSWHTRPEYKASRERWLKNELAEEGGLCIMPRLLPRSPRFLLSVQAYCARNQPGAAFVLCDKLTSSI